MVSHDWYFTLCCLLIYDFSLVECVKKSLRHVWYSMEGRFFSHSSDFFLKFCKYVNSEFVSQFTLFFTIQKLYIAILSFFSQNSEFTSCNSFSLSTFFSQNYDYFFSHNSDFFFCHKIKKIIGSFCLTIQTFFSQLPVYISHFRLFFSELWQNSYILSLYTVCKFCLCFLRKLSLQFWHFSHNSEFTFHNSDIFPQNSEFKSCNFVFIVCLFLPWKKKNIWLYEKVMFQSNNITFLFCLQQRKTSLFLAYIKIFYNSSFCTSNSWPVFCFALSSVIPHSSLRSLDYAYVLLHPLEHHSLVNVDNSSQTVYKVLNLDIFLTQTHCFVSEGLY